MTEYAQRCLIIPADYAPLARALCAGLTDGGSGAGMFTTAVSADGALPATHCISEGLIGLTFAALLPLATYNTNSEGISAQTTTPGRPKIIVRLAKGAVSLAQVEALLAATDVTEQNPFTALARMGLQLIQTKEVQ